MVRAGGVVGASGRRIVVIVVLPGTDRAVTWTGQRSRGGTRDGRTFP